MADPLEFVGDEARILASAVGSVLRVTLDRPELQYAAKRAASDISKPTELTRMQVKRIVRFLIEPRLEWLRQRLGS